MLITCKSKTTSTWSIVTVCSTHNGNINNRWPSLMDECLIINENKDNVCNNCVHVQPICIGTPIGKLARNCGHETACSCILELLGLVR